MTLSPFTAAKLIISVGMNMATGLESGGTT